MITFLFIIVKIMKIDPYVRFAMHHVYIEGYFIERDIWDHEIIYIEEGRMKITINGNEYIANEGDVVFLRPRIPHKIEWDGVDCKQPHVHFDFIEREDSKDVGVSLRLKKQMSIEDKRLFRNDFLKENNIDLPYVFKLKEPRIVRTILYKLINEYEYRFYEHELILKGLFMELFGTILRDYHLGKIERDGNSMKEINLLLEFMIENVENNLLLNDLVEYSGIDKWNLNRLFKNIYSITPIKYYNMLRISRAKNLLMYSGLNIKQITYRMNFDTPQTFSRWFKNNDGNTPRSYMK